MTERAKRLCLARKKTTNGIITNTNQGSEENEHHYESEELYDYDPGAGFIKLPQETTSNLSLEYKYVTPGMPFTILEHLQIRPVKIPRI